MGRAPYILEKDVWVCWALKQLFIMPGAPKMVFKGGTSLSKVYNAIDRFSEDVDVTISRSDLAPNLDPFEKDLSRTQQKLISKELDSIVQQYVVDTVQPYLSSCVAGNFDENTVRISIDDSKAYQARISYESALGEGYKYVPQAVLLEFGGKNKMLPNEDHVLAPYIAEYITDLSYPEASVVVLSPQRTFWEKATLIHAECNRDTMRPSVDRLSRHWYDLAKLAQHSIGEEAIINTDLLSDVVTCKEVLYYTARAKYEDCLNGNLRLVPNEELSQALEKDYNEMIKANMFWDDPPTFRDICDSLGSIEEQLNEVFKA